MPNDLQQIRHEACTGLVDFFAGAIKFNADDPSWSIDSAVEGLIEDDKTTNPDFMSATPQQQVAMIAGARAAAAIAKSGGDQGQCP
ncbi:hypothetical protein GCM10027167_77080 [Nocardia heshunensis]